LFLWSAGIHPRFAFGFAFGFVWQKKKTKAAMNRRTPKHPPRESRDRDGAAAGMEFAICTAVVDRIL
jgi:hypothetical protein